MIFLLTESGFRVAAFASRRLLTAGTNYSQTTETKRRRRKTASLEIALGSFVTQSETGGRRETRGVPRKLLNTLPSFFEGISFHRVAHTDKGQALLPHSLATCYRTPVPLLFQTPQNNSKHIPTPYQQEIEINPRTRGSLPFSYAFCFSTQAAPWPCPRVFCPLCTARNAS